jgi:hypothetical protein
MSAAQRAGVVTFAGVLFITVGLFNILDGIVALARPEQLYVGENALVVKDFDAWGVVLIVLGSVQTLVGLGVLSGSRVAQILGIALASANFIIQLAFFKHYPAWSVAVMVIDIVIIYALCAYSAEFGRTATRARR